MIDDHKLVSMANQIAAFFHAYPEADAMAAVREHIELFWTPRMRSTLDARINSNPGGIDPLVLSALAAREPPPGNSPIKKQAAGPDTLGQLASDAG